MEDRQLQAALKEIDGLKAALKQKQSELAANRLAAIVDSSDDAIISKDLGSIVITWNKGAEKIFGYSAEEMVGTSIMRLIPADRHEEENHILAKIRRGENVEHFQTLRQTKDGRLIDVSVTASPIKDAEGRIVGVSKVARDITERNRAEKLLRLLGSAVEQSTESILITDAQLDLPGPKIIFVNPAFTQMTGYTAAEAMGKTPRILQGPRTDKAVLRRLRQSLERGEMFAGESVNYRKDGKEFDMEWQITPLRDAGGKITRFVATQRDITQRKQVEHALRASEERMRLATEATAVGIWEWNVLTNDIRWDAQMFRIYGMAPTKDGLVEYTAWSGAVLPEDLREQEELLQDTVRRCGRSLREFRIWRIDRQCRHIQSVETVRTNAQGQVEWVVGTNLDITERKRAERRLTTQSAISRALADSHTLNEALPKIIQAICESEGWDFGAIWEADKKSGKMRCREAWHRPELSAEELLVRTRGLTFALNIGLPGRVWASGKPFLIPDIASDDNYPRQALAAQVGLHSAVAFPIMLEGEVIGVIDFLGREIHATDEEMLEMLLGIGRQIGSFFKRTKLEEQFRQSQKMEGIGQLAGGVAHDFNNILAIIQIQSELMKTSGGLSARQAEFADEISLTVQRAAALTRQLLLFSRREVFQPRDLDLNESVTSTTKMLRRILGENIQVQLRLASQPMFIHADAAMMDQVLLNLAVNARDAMPNGGQLVIETSGVEFDEFAVTQSPQARPGSFVRLNVSDSGCGIPPENLSKIFEPFFTTKEVGKGTGLGLATVFGIVQQHQGWINVYSEVNHGTTFRVYVPRLAKNGGKKSPQPALAATSGGNETILLAEDDPSLRVSVRKALSQLGYRILEAPTGVKALEVWKDNRAEIRLLLTDLVMPDGMSGKDLAERILQEDPRLKVIYMSGYSAEVVGKDFPLKEGVNFLAKPFQASKLAQTIRDNLDQPV